MGVLYFSSFQLEQAACNCSSPTTLLLPRVPLSCINRQKHLCRGDVDFAYSNFAIGGGLREFDPMSFFKEETTALQIGAITTRIFKAQSLNKVKVGLFILAPIMRISESVTDGCQPYLCPWAARGSPDNYATHPTAGTRCAHSLRIQHTRSKSNIQEDVKDLLQARHTLAGPEND